MSGEHVHPEYASMQSLEALSTKVGDIDARLARAEAAGPYALSTHVHSEVPSPPPPVDPPPVDPPPVDPPTGERVPLDPFVIRDKHDEVVENFTVDARGGWGVQIINCTNVTLRNFGIDRGGLKIERSTGTRVEDGYVQRNIAGNPNWSDEEACIRVRYSTDTIVKNVVGAYGDCIFRGEAFDGLTFDGCFTFNPRGPFPRGQHFQTWPFEGNRSKNLTIRNHYSLTDFSNPGYGPLWQEDAFNLSGVDGVLIENTFNEMVRADLCPSNSGTGAITEVGATDVRFIGFTSVGQANHGISISGGAKAYLENVLAFYDGIGTDNDGRRPAGSGHTAGVVRQGSTCEFGPNVRFYGTKPNGTPYGAFWNDDSSTLINKGAAKFGTYESAGARAEYNALVRPAIPSVGWEMPSELVAI